MLSIRLAAAVLVALAATAVRAEAPPGGGDPSDTPASVPMLDPNAGAVATDAAPEPNPAVAAEPKTAETTPAGDPNAAPGAVAGQALPPGQWVFTQQYGWVWMPHEQRYTYVNDAGDLAFMYGYYPSMGWRWMASPWVLGYGPTPYWGHYGCVHFAWYGRPWFRPGAYRPAAWGPYLGPSRPFYLAPPAHPRPGEGHPMGVRPLPVVRPMPMPIIRPMPAPAFRPVPPAAPPARFGAPPIHRGGFRPR
jgi:hypothetical protein